jgi:predicted aspartyl protease
VAPRPLTAVRTVSISGHDSAGPLSYNEAAMGLMYVDGVVSGSTGPSRNVRFLVDSGAKYSLLPVDDWRAIGLAPLRRVTFVLADGTQIDRDVSECRIELPQGAGHTPVILGEAGDEALLGVVTLENLGLVLHPFSRTLQPARMLLA